jgi:peptidoglycan/LPS O-acetylase OafA/YrhL
MDLRILGALALLVIWAIAALVLEGPGWVHLLLTIGVSLLVYGVVARGSNRDGAGRG